MSIYGGLIMNKCKKNELPKCPKKPENECIQTTRKSIRKPCIRLLNGSDTAWRILPRCN